MKRFLKWFALTLPLLTTACHYQFTGPLLWNHGDSFAANMCASLWIINLTFLVVVVLLIKVEK